VDDCGVSAEGFSQVSDLHEPRQRFARVREAERRDFDLSWAQQHAAGEVVGAHCFGNFEVGAGLDHAGFGAQARGERVRGDVHVDRGRFGGGWLEHCESFEVGGRVQDAIDGVCRGGGGHDEAGCEEEGDEGGGYECLSGAAGAWWGTGGSRRCGG
jgi:hypothetical protein